MAANACLGEKGAVTVPLAIFVSNLIGIIITFEIYGEIQQGGSARFLGISFGFLNFPDKTRLQPEYSLYT